MQKKIQDFQYDLNIDKNCLLANKGSDIRYRQRMRNTLSLDHGCLNVLNVRDYRTGYPRQFSRTGFSIAHLCRPVGSVEPLAGSNVLRMDRGESATINRAIYEAARPTTILEK